MYINLLRWYILSINSYVINFLFSCLTQEYLCLHHNQDTVNTHKECINEQCPLAKHMGPLDCAAWEAEHPESVPDIASTDGSPEEAERQEHNHNAACQIVDLMVACPDESIVEHKLHERCKDKAGTEAAKCFYEYLCEFHNQNAVLGTKSCIDHQCPLAKHVPALDCEAWKTENHYEPVPIGMTAQGSGGGKKGGHFFAVLVTMVVAVAFAKLIYESHKRKTHVSARRVEIMLRELHDDQQFK